MANQTQDNIIRKRRIKKRRRRLKIFRLLTFLLIMSGILWTGFHVVQWGMRTFDTYYGIYQDYEEKQSLRQSAIAPRFIGYTNILLLGLDDGQTHELGQQADTILLVSLDKEKGDIRVISIPGGTMTMIAGRPTPEKISQAYAYGGVALTRQTVTTMTGIPIQRYAAIDAKTVAAIIDALGGMDLYVEYDMDYEDPEDELYIHIKKGYQHMDGNTAQKYLRYRGGELGDVGRVQRQNRFIKALYERLLRINTVTSLPLLVDIVQNRVNTNMELLDTTQFAGVIHRLSTAMPKTIMLPGISQAADDTVWVPSEEGVDRMLDELFPKPEEQ